VFQPILNIRAAVHRHCFVQLPELIHSEVRGGLSLELKDAPMLLILLQHLRCSMAEHNVPEFMKERVTWMDRERVNGNLTAVGISLNM